MTPMDKPPAEDSGRGLPARSASNTPRRRTSFGTPGHSLQPQHSQAPGSSKTPSYSGKRKLKRTPSCGRFIPARSGVDKELQFHQIKMSNTEENKDPKTSMDRLKDEFSEQLAKSIFEKDRTKSKVLKFQVKAPVPSQETFDATSVNSIYSRNSLASSKPKAMRYVSSNAERVLDAPDLVDDFYLNVLDWSSKNVLAVALGQCVYLWNATNGTIKLLTETEDPDDVISSLSWLPGPSGGSHLAVGTSSCEVQLWDVEQAMKIRVFNEHSGRVTALAWNNHILTTGGKDSKIFNHDVRCADHLVSTMGCHTQEVCGLKWSPDGLQLASGGNDNLVCIWDLNSHSSHPKFQIAEHNAAVKALAWSPHQRHLLASGGGTADRQIKFWSTATGACLNSIDAKSQVSALVWNPYENELLSAHGFSQVQLTLWRYPALVSVADLVGHTSRILHAALSPDGTTVCSAGADETLRFWKVFEPINKKSIPGKGALIADKKIGTRTGRMPGAKIR